MKRLICLLLLSKIALSSWACSCIGIYPINLTSQYAEQLVIAKLKLDRPYSNAIEVQIKQVIKGSAELAGKSVILWQDYLDCSALPRIDTSKEYVLAFDQIAEEYLAYYLAYSKELQAITDSSSYANTLTKMKARQHFVLPGCSVSSLQLEDQMKVELAYKYKKKKKRNIIRKRRRSFSREAFIDYLTHLEHI